MRHDEARAYIRSLRNPAKQGYAYVLWNWHSKRACILGFDDPAPEPSNLGAMGAQAVRLRLAEYVTHVQGEQID